MKRLAFYDTSYSLPNSSSGVRFLYKSNSALFFEICTSQNYFPKLLDYELARPDTIRRANESIKTNALNESDRVDRLLMVGYQVGSRLLRRFWRPKEFISRKVEAYVRDRFKPHYMIGMHLRAQYLNENDIMAFVECALGLEKEVQNH